MDKKAMKNQNNDDYNKNAMSYFSDAINHSKIGDIRALTKGNWYIKILTLFILIILIYFFF